MKPILLITDHAIRRFCEAANVHLDKIPKRGRVLNRYSVKGLKAIVRTMFRFLHASKKVELPERALFFKLMKHGVKDHTFFESRRILFNIVHEDEYVLVTTVLIPKERIREHTLVEPTVHGYSFLSLIEKIRFNYKLRQDLHDESDHFAFISYNGSAIPFLFSEKNRKPIDNR